MLMQTCASPRVLLLLAVSVVITATGCHEGYLARYSSWHPTVQRRWALEQERYGYNLESRLQELSKLRRRAKKIGEQEREKITLELAELLKNERNSILRSSVVATLAELNNSRADRALLDSLEDESSLVRRAACHAIARRGGEAGVVELVRVMQSDDDQDVRLAAAEVLGRFRQNDVAIRALGVLLDETDPALQFQAMRSLESVTGKKFGNDVPAWRKYLTGGNPPERRTNLVNRIIRTSQ